MTEVELLDHSSSMFGAERAANIGSSTIMSDTALLISITTAIILTSAVAG